MKINPHTLTVLPDRLTVCRLEPDQPVPDWAQRGGFYSITRTDEELSIVCREENAPENIRCERGWRALTLEGPLDFSLVGVLSSLLVPLAEQGISIFALSTYDTDTILVKAEHLTEAVNTLCDAGHSVRTGIE